MLKIGELAKEAEVDPQTIRFYEKIALIPKPVRTGNRYRQYGENDIKRLKFIKKGRALGLNLTQIAHIMDIKEKGESPCPEVRLILEAKLLQLKEKIAILKSFQDEFQVYLKNLPEEGIEGDICGCIESHKMFIKKQFS